MAVEMVKLFLIGISTASYMFSLAIFKGTALLLVTTLRVLQFPGWAANSVLILIRESIINAIKTVLEISGQSLVSAVDTGVELISNATTTAVSSFAEVMKEKQELFRNATAEVFQLATETGAGIASNFSENFWEGVDILIKYFANNE